MITVRLKGGLGNQLFQYAAGYAMAKRLSSPMELDISFFDTQSLRGFKLDRFKILYTEKAQVSRQPIAVRVAKEKHIGALIRDITRPHEKKSFRVGRDYVYLLESGKALLKEFFTLNCKDIYLDGYFQSDRYFLEVADELKNQIIPGFELSTSYNCFLEKVQSTNSVAVHVRRGDFLKDQHDWHYILEADYYIKAIEEIKQWKKDATFYWFSNDINWVKNNVPFASNDVFVSLDGDNADIEEMMLMKNCNHIITANSTFSWWAAWLNDHKDAIRIVPDKPYGNDHMIPDGWIKIPVE